MGPKGGRREKHPRGRIVAAISYVVRTGCAWRQMPKDFPPRRTRCTGTSPGGTTTAQSSGSMTLCAARCVKSTAATWSRGRA
ncbi:transposase [Streptomyces sp. NPDC059499]|uniref:transposase n=1 Tax=Streptomyces sp. NPDC059499 TaxID=3346852 RepID=UPI0036828EC0